jgi:DNA (cytosine-5)-methyltransferase 1
MYAMVKKRLKGISLFAGAGIGETYFKDIGIDIVVANELLEKRANLYNSISPGTKVICGDITDEKIFNQIIASCPEKVDFMLASPPCQGMSVAGKNRCQKTMETDERNYLITYVVKVIRATTPDYILIENVPTLLKLKLMYDSKYRTVLEILKYEFGSEYTIDSDVIDSSDYGVPQTRLRAIIKMYKPNTVWNWPDKKEKVTVEQAIGNLPSLEAGEKSNIQWHFARNHTKENILWMKHTPTGKSAFSNPVYYPQKKDGTRIKGYESSYRRIRWDAPSPTITIRNDCIASQRNVHPGRLLPDGTYSDARVLTPLELMLLNSLPADWNIPADTPELLIRQCIGESIPPLMLKEIVRGIYDEQD